MVDLTKIDSEESNLNFQLDNKFKYEILQFNPCWIIIRKYKTFLGIKYDPLIIKINVNNDPASIFLNDYSMFVQKTFNENPLHDRHLELLHCAVGLAEETGEILGHIKKHVFHSKPLDIIKVKSECGDATWYQFALFNLLGISLQEVITGNRIKLMTRYPNGRNKNYKMNVRNEDIENENIAKS